MNLKNKKNPYKSGTPGKTPGAYLFLLTVLFLLTGCSPLTTQNTKPVSQIRTDLLGTVISVSLFEDAEDSVFTEIFKPIENVSMLMSSEGSGSELTLISDMAGLNSVKVSDEVYEVIKLAKQISEDSGGAFDLTVAPLVRLWGIGTENPRIPSDSELHKAKALVDYNSVILDDKNKSVYLSKTGMGINLGAIAKGYAGDMAAEVVKTKGIAHAILDLGGNIITVGSRYDGTDWRVGIRTPIIGAADNIGILRVTNKSIVTSGGYERFFTENDVIYHHILDPFSGFPAQTGLLSVTVVCSDSTAADMLSTAVFILGYERGLELLAKYGAEAVFVTEDKTVLLTDGLKDSFSLTNTEFKLVSALSDTEGSDAQD